MGNECAGQSHSPDGRCLCAPSRLLHTTSEGLGPIFQSSTAYVSWTHSCSGLSHSFEQTEVSQGSHFMYMTLVSVFGASVLHLHMSGALKPLGVNEG